MYNETLVQHIEARIREEYILIKKKLIVAMNSEGNVFLSIDCYL